jgi:hypothetical protein
MPEYPSPTASWESEVLMTLWRMKVHETSTILITIILVTLVQNLHSFKIVSY